MDAYRFVPFEIEGWGVEIKICQKIYIFPYILNIIVMVKKEKVLYTFFIHTRLCPHPSPSTRLNCIAKCGCRQICPIWMWGVGKVKIDQKWSYFHMSFNITVTLKRLQVLLKMFICTIIFLKPFPATMLIFKVKCAWKQICPIWTWGGAWSKLAKNGQISNIMVLRKML